MHFAHSPRLQRESTSNIKAGLPVRGSRGIGWGRAGGNGGGYGDFLRAPAARRKDTTVGGEIMTVIYLVLFCRPRQYLTTRL